MKERLDYDAEATIISHLSNDQVDKMMKAYYHKQARPNDLMQKYGFKIHPSQFFKVFPPVIIRNETCPYDHSHLVYPLSARSGYYISGFIRFFNKKNKKYCPQCHHKPAMGDKCPCVNCEHVRKVKYKKREIAISDLTWKMSLSGQVNLADISLLNRIYLASLVKGYYDNQYNYVPALGKKMSMFIPYFDDSANILDNLVNSDRLLNIRSSSPIHAFKFNARDDEVLQYDPESVDYSLNVQNDYEDEQTFIESIRYPNREQYLADPQSCLDIWQHIIVSETKLYVKFELHKHFSDAILDKGIDDVILYLLKQSFSESQIFKMIRDITTHQNEFSPSILNQYSKQFRINAKSLRDYSPKPRILKNYASQVFFTDILRLSDKQAYKTVPSLKALKEIK